MSSRTFTRYLTIFAKWVLAAAIIYCGVLAYFLKQDVNRKAEWAKFQGAHSNLKSISIQHLEIHDWSGSKFLVCPAEGENVVIMLNPEYSPFYKQWPYSSTFVLRRKDFFAVIAGQDYKISDTVSEVLKSKTAEPTSP